MRLPQLSAIRLRLLLLLLLLLLYLYLTSFFLMLQAGERRSVKQKAQAFTSGQSRSRPDSGTVEGCARQPRCTKNPRGSEVERIHNSAKHNETHCIAEWKESTRL